MPKEPAALQSSRKALFHAAQTGDELFVRDNARTSEVRILVQPASNDTLLHVAARSGHLTVIKAIIGDLQLKHFLTSANQDGKCALHEAAQSLHPEVVQYLIDQGTPVDILKRADWTPLMLACTRNDSSKTISVLLANGARPNLRNKDGWTALHVATRKGNLDAMKLLLRSDSTLWNTWSKNGRCPLHTAAIHGHESIVDYLLNSTELAVDCQDSCGSTPLMDAARFGSIECCELLLNRNASIHVKDKVGRNVLHVAAQAGCSTQIIDILLNNGVDVNCLTDNRQTALHLAARENHADTFRVLVDKGADLSVRDSLGATVRDICSSNCSLAIIDLLNNIEDQPGHVF